MTNEEAIKNQLKPLLKLHFEKPNGDADVEFYEAIEKAISALEKQIPKKAEWTVDGSWGVKSKQPVCPACDYYLTKFQFIGDGEKKTYCEYCGQAIDWSEE